jgi:hypothetical protein
MGIVHPWHAVKRAIREAKLPVIKPGGPRCRLLFSEDLKHGQSLGR